MYLNWGLGIGDWPNPQSPIPNPQSPNYIEEFTNRSDNYFYSFRGNRLAKRSFKPNDY